MIFFFLAGAAAGGSMQSCGCFATVLKRFSTVANQTLDRNRYHMVLFKMLHLHFAMCVGTFPLHRDGSSFLFSTQQERHLGDADRTTCVCVFTRPALTV